MSDEDDWDFAGTDDAQMTIRAAVRYLLKGADASEHILVEIIEIVRQAAHDLPPDQPDPFDDAPGGSVAPPAGEFGTWGVVGPRLSAWGQEKPEQAVPGGIS